MERIKQITNIEAIGELIKEIQTIENRDDRITDLKRLISRVSTVMDDEMKLIQELIKNVILLNSIPIVVDEAVVDYVDIVLNNRAAQLTS